MLTSCSSRPRPRATGRGRKRIRPNAKCPLVLEVGFGCFAWLHERNFAGPYGRQISLKGALPMGHSNTVPEMRPQPKRGQNYRPSHRRHRGPIHDKAPCANSNMMANANPSGHNGPSPSAGHWPGSALAQGNQSGHAPKTEHSSVEQEVQAKTAPPVLPAQLGARQRMEGNHHGGHRPKGMALRAA